MLIPLYYWILWQAGVTGVLSMKSITEGIIKQPTRPPKRLSATFVKTVTRPRRYGDGRGSHGLSLLGKSMKLGGHSRTWSQRLRINGKPVSIGLGSFPVVTLAEARKAALENRRALARGNDPRSSVPTLAQASESVLAIHSASWKDGARSAQIWRNSLRDYVLPQLGRVRVDLITTADIMVVPLPHWATKHETMRRIKQRLSRIFRWAVAEGYRTDDPAGATLDAAFRRVAAWGGRDRDRDGAEQRSLAGHQGRLRVSGPDGLPVRGGPAVAVAGSRSGCRDLDDPGGSLQDRPRTQGSAGSASACRAGRRATTLGWRGANLSVRYRQAAVGRDAVEAAPGARHSGGSAWIPVVLPGLVRGDGPVARGCRSMFGACRQEQGRGGLRAIGPAQSASGPDAGVGRVSLRCCLNERTWNRSRHHRHRFSRFDVALSRARAVVPPMQQPSPALAGKLPWCNTHWSEAQFGPRLRSWPFGEVAPVELTPGGKAGEPTGHAAWRAV